MRLLHTMIRVGQLQRSIDFYTRILGMTLLRQKNYPKVVSRWLLLVMVMKKKIQSLN